MSFPKYPKYKSSGVAWLGEVPEHWEVCAIKRRIRSATGGTSIKGQCADEPSDGLYPGFSASGQDVWLQHYDYSTNGIVLSAVGARCGKAFKADGVWGVVANTHCLFPSVKSDRDFLWYLTNDETWWEKGGSAQPFIKVNETLARTWAFPPLSEQTQIAEFLDRETGMIDALVAEQRRLMELLKEKRQAVISHAVTRGLNPKVPLKPSGIEWLGDVPEHWEVRSVKRIVHMQSGESITAETIAETGDFPVFGGNGLRGYTSAFTNDGDFVLIGRQGALCGNINFAQGKFWASEHAIVATPIVPVATRWLGELLYTMNLNQYSISAAQPGLSVELIGNLQTVYPPLDEQIQITAFLDTQTAKFDALTAEAQRAINLLQERRTALISAAVTGQIDVREQIYAKLQREGTHKESLLVRKEENRKPLEP